MTGAIPTTLNQLRAKIFYDFNNFPQNYVQCYVTSMRRRCIAVVNSAGDILATKFTWTWTPLRDLTYKNIVVFTLFCDIFDQVWSLVKYRKKCEI